MRELRHRGAKQLAKDYTAQSGILLGRDKMRMQFLRLGGEKRVDADAPERGSRLAGEANQTEEELLRSQRRMAEGAPWSQVETWKMLKADERCVTLKEEK